ncbi:MAG: triose-phosphate isomerase, partial [Alphaproteobacteria bacterium]
MSGQTDRRRPLIAGNWKMNGLRADGLALAEALGAWAKGREAAGGERGADMLICPPATLLGAVSEVLAGSWVAVGGQDCHGSEKGA